jgi:hypothetical protein
MAALAAPAVARAQVSFELGPTLGPVIGAGAAVRLFRGLRATLGAFTIFYTLDLPMPPRLSGNPGSLQRGKQADLQLQVGLTWLLGAAR